jgi:pentatricopeptide repeat protein
MQDKKITVGAVTYVTVIDAILCSEDQLDTALNLFSEMKQVRSPIWHDTTLNALHSM